MIAVIADDLTGAAEIGGVGLQHGLRVEVVTSPKNALDVNCDLLVIDTDTRSLPLTKARAKTRLVMEQIVDLQPQFIFKKIDSALRGHVLAELGVMQKITIQKQAFIVAGNPELGRTIKDGFYYVDGKPIHKTGFAHDPEFPIKSHLVDDILKVNGMRTTMLSVGQPLPAGGTLVGNIETIQDFTMWANTLQPHPEILLAGTSLFFDALLKSKGFPPLAGTSKSIAVQCPALFVSGTAFGDRVAIVRDLAKNGGPVVFAPPALFQTKLPSKKVLMQWAETTINTLQKGKAVLAFDGNAIPDGIGAVALRKMKAQVVELILSRMEIKELIIEGGSTAAAIFKALHIHRLRPVQELMPGVVRMKIEDPDTSLFVTVKPGSYPWPPNFWNFD